MNDIYKRLKSYEPFFGTYELGDKIGEGSSGYVYEVKHKSPPFTKRALKVITVPKDREHFETIRISLPAGSSVKQHIENLISVHLKEVEFLEMFEGNSYFVDIKNHEEKKHPDSIGSDILILMELLHDVSKSAEKNIFDELTVINLGIDICTALEFVQAEKVMHMDIKPQNIFMTHLGGFKLGDFGIAYKTNAENNYRLGLTSKAYAAPEVWKEDIFKTFDSRYDIYSLGIVMYKLLNKNRLPFVNNGISDGNAVKKRMDGETIPRLQNCDGDLNDIVLKACAFYKRNRYSDVSQMKKELIIIKERIKQTEPIIEHEEIIDYEATMPIDYINTAFLSTDASTGESTPTLIIPNITDNDKPVKPEIKIAPVIQHEAEQEPNIKIDTIKKEKPDEPKKTLDSDNKTIGQDSPFYFDFRTGVITGLRNKATDLQNLEIPGDIGGRQVKKVGERAFYSCPNLLNVSISPNLRFFEIENEAFRACVNLQSIEIPSAANLSVSIGSGAFKDCINLNSAKISNRVASIGEGAFQNCGSVTIICPKGSNIHKYCVDRNLKTQILFDKPEILVKRTARRMTPDSGSLNIPAEYTDIGKSAFEKRKDIKNIIVPATIERISDFAFEKCVNLEHISIPNSVIYIGKSAFWGCEKLKEITIPKNIEKIENSTFWGCVNLGKIVIDGKVESIGKYAFWDCDSLIYIKISSKVKNIGENAFADNSRLTVICQQNSFAYNYCVKNKINTDTSSY